VFLQLHIFLISKSSKFLVTNPDPHELSITYAGWHKRKDRLIGNGRNSNALCAKRSKLAQRRCACQICRQPELQPQPVERLYALRVPWPRSPTYNLLLKQIRGCFRGNVERQLLPIGAVQTAEQTILRWAAIGQKRSFHVRIILVREFFQTHHVGKHHISHHRFEWRYAASRIIGSNGATPPLRPNRL